MQSVAYFTLLVAFASLALGSSQPEQPIQSGPVSVVESVQVVPGQQQQQAPVVGNSPVVQPQSGVVVVESQQGVVPVEHQQPQYHHHHHQQPQQHSPAGASYYAPAGLIQVVGSEQQQHQVNKPGMVRSVEQYGQPEPASLPPNYKPFGSWGLYIGGNPADGYYTDYYKHLSSSVEKQQQQQQQSGEQASAKPISALSPMLKQAGGSPFAGGDYYPFAYSMNDLSSVSRTYQPVVEQAIGQQPPQQQQVVVPVSPVQVGAQVYGSPASFESNHYGVSPYADSYATKRVGTAYGAQKEAPRAVEQQPQAGKGYQSRVYVYPAQASPLASAPMVAQQQPQQQQYQPQQYQPQQQQAHHQVVAYPVPVSSQIVGSQAGVDGAFAPYGVHAFTRYSVKPTMVSNSESSAGYHYGVSSQLPTYKQHSAVYSQQVSGPNAAQGTHYYQPLSYYGYPLSQLHYSQGSIVPAVHGGEVHHNPAVSQVEAASEKSETTAAAAAAAPAEEKSQVGHSSGSSSSSSSHKQHQAAQSQKRA